MGRVVKKNLDGLVVRPGPAGGVIASYFILVSRGGYSLHRMFSTWHNVLFLVSSCAISGGVSHGRVRLLNDVACGP
ncbi:hypothetical protein V8F20_002470 [Naviculisporaceae sp. PSN 640]